MLPLVGVERHAIDIEISGLGAEQVFPMFTIYADRMIHFASAGEGWWGEFSWHNRVKSDERFSTNL